MLSNLAELISAADNLIPGRVQPQKVKGGARSREDNVEIFVGFMESTVHVLTIQATVCDVVRVYIVKTEFAIIE
jgi:hypothetical protein